MENENKEENQDKPFNSDSVTRERCVDAIKQFFVDDKKSLAEDALELSEKMAHVMEYTIIRVIEAAMALIRKGISNVLEYN